MEKLRYLLLLLLLHIICFILLIEMQKFTQDIQDHDDLIGTLNVGINIKRLFPERRYKAFCRISTYEIVKIELEQSGLPKCAMIQTYHPKKKIHQLWSILPFSVSPPPQILYQSKSTFTWSTNDSLNIVVLSETTESPSSSRPMLSIKIFEQTEMKKGTLGSWHQRQVFHLDIAPRNTSRSKISTNILESVSPLHISISTNGKTIFASNNAGVYALFQLEESPVEYFFQRMMMDKSKIDFLVFPHCIHYDEDFMVIASPFFKQTDGVVDIYKFPQKDLDLYNISLQQSILPPFKASYFGAHCALANVVLEHRLNSNVILLVSAPFAPNKNNQYGAGAVLMYQYVAMTFQLQQIIYCPETFSFAETAILNFGYIFDVSQNGEWLAVSVSHGGYGMIYIFQLDKRTFLYEYRQKIILESPLAQNFGKCLSIDDKGTLLIADQYNVYFSFGISTLTSDSKPIVVKSESAHRKTRLRNYSPNRLSRHSRTRTQSKV